MIVKEKFKRIFTVKHGGLPFELREVDPDGKN